MSVQDVIAALDDLRTARVALYEASAQRQQLIALRKLTPAKALETAEAILDARQTVAVCKANVQARLLELPIGDPTPRGLIRPDP